MNIGVTEPKYALLDDGTQAIVKLSHGPEGNLVLFNEFVCSRMAILLDLPMPYCGICEMDQDTEICVPGIASEDNIGRAFYSKFLPKVTILRATVINQIQNKSDFIKLLLFDHIIFNMDRNEGNLLVQFYKQNILLKIIDHTHVFINGAIWDANCLRRAMEEKDFLSTRVLENNNRVYSMFYRDISIEQEKCEEIALGFKEKISREVLLKIIQDCPAEWQPDKASEEMLIEYLLYRIDHLDIIISTILNYIK